MSVDLSVVSQKPSSFLGRAIPVLLALLATGGLIYWFVKPKPDIRYARTKAFIQSQIKPGGEVLQTLERGAEVNVMLSRELDGWAMVMVPPSSNGFIPLSDIDVDRRPVLTGAYRAKALQKPISLYEEPDPATAQTDAIPPGTMIQIWGYTETPTGKWAEITRYKEKRVGYVLRDELEAASD
ncbi:hypothetical protein [Aquidulcibacter paucihalophilus]|uniref:hypothetical protein n=1 Tax=Aquidulcibacter paucihalophilus TaxID=1978549 RepID=UPI000A1947F6|nr:hypothetical protein [Aquidulcibacter paucihalophilus]